MAVNHKKWRFLLSPWSVLVGILLGLYIGIYNKSLIPYIAPFGILYLNILKMCILPILITAISTSLGKFMKSKVSGSYIKKMVLVFIVAMLVFSSIGTIIGLINKPGSNLGRDKLTALSRIIQESSRDFGLKPDLEINFSEPYVPANKTTALTRFFMKLIPANIFNALSIGANLKVLFFAILAGLAIGFIKEESADLLFSLLHAVNLTFSKIVTWLMYILPIGLCGLISDQLSGVGIGILINMTRFLFAVFICYGLGFLICVIILRLRCGGSFYSATFQLKEPLLIALATGNSLAAIPSSLSSMHKKLHFNQQLVNFIVPIGITVCRLGPVLYFGIASMFIIQLYQIPLTMQILAIVVFGSVLAGMATAGASGIVTLYMLSLILDPLGLPLDAVLVLLFVIDPLTAPFRSITNVFGACAGAAIIITPETRLTSS